MKCLFIWKPCYTIDFALLRIYYGFSTVLYATAAFSIIVIILRLVGWFGCPRASLGGSPVACRNCSWGVFPASPASNYSTVAKRPQTNENPPYGVHPLRLSFGM